MSSQGAAAPINKVIHFFLLFYGGEKKPGINILFLSLPSLSFFAGQDV